jgi:UDPglucose--hexose-1-phosphate uridylyltransferase
LNKKTGCWQVKSFANGYPAFTPEGSRKRRKEGEVFVSMDGVGFHEVIVEGPIHNRVLALMEMKKWKQCSVRIGNGIMCLLSYPLCRGYLFLKIMGDLPVTSLEHPHSQLIATPLVPRYIRMQCNVAIHYYDDTCRCLLADITTEELSQAKRVVMGKDKFVVFHPFASHSPFETWITPKRYEACFGNVTDKELKELSHTLRITLLKLYKDLTTLISIMSSAPFQKGRRIMAIFYGICG